VLVATHHQLVGAGDQAQAVEMVELISDVFTEDIASSSLVAVPVVDIIWVRPKEVGKGTLVRNLHASLKSVQLIERSDVWAETTVDAEDFAFHDCRHRQVVKHVVEVVPWVWVAVFAEALVVEAINSANVSRLVVASQDSHALRVAQLKKHEQGEGLN